jgi:low temperature requirement protein LtrA
MPPLVSVPPVTDDDAVRGGTERTSTTIELFFDLVYVFAITQVTGLLHLEPSGAGLAKGAFLLMLLWWTWSIYTWTTNWTGTASVPIKLFLLATMGTTLVMATAVPDAFGDSSVLFGVTFFVVRLLAGVLYWVASASYPTQRSAFYTFFPASTTGAALVMVGSFMSGGWLWAFYGAGAALDVLISFYSARGDWAVDAAHFQERNGLFVIIALGESIVAVGLSFAEVDSDLRHIAALVVSFVWVASLWWAYFDRAAPYAEKYFRRLHGRERARFARDAYSFLLYPLVVGVVFCAVGLEDLVAHPSEPLPATSQFALGVGTALVLLAVAAGTYRAIRRLTVERLVAAAALLGLVVVDPSWDALTFATVSAAVTVVALTVERSHAWPQPREEAEPGTQ